MDITEYYRKRRKDKKWKESIDAIRGNLMIEFAESYHKQATTSTTRPEERRKELFEIIRKNVVRIHCPEDKCLCELWNVDTENFKKEINAYLQESVLSHEEMLERRKKLEYWAKEIYPNDSKSEDAFITGADWHRNEYANRLLSNRDSEGESIFKDKVCFECGSQATSKSLSTQNYYCDIH